MTTYNTSAYMLGRKKYQRPQAMLFADNPGILVDGLYIPEGYEIGADSSIVVNQDYADQFVILSDDNRGEISFTPTRLEKRERMINGRMRSHHIADKMTISTSWDMLPSRAFGIDPNFLSAGQTFLSPSAQSIPDPVNPGSFISVPAQKFTTDGGAGGVELLDWYENHPGSFWVYLSYDKYNNFSNPETKYANLQKYNEVIEVYFADFQYSVVKRGGSNHDFWNISLTLEEA
jgi:hypothetical protein